MVAAFVGDWKLRLPNPSFTYTNTFANLPSSATIVSAVLLPLQAGSWLMSIFDGFGAAPSNFTVPVTSAAVAGSIGVAGAAAAVFSVSALEDCSVFSFLLHAASRTIPSNTHMLAIAKYAFRFTALPP